MDPGWRQQIEPQLLEGALSIIRALVDAGHEAYFAGGVVRDILLGLAVESDIDIATSARPEEVESLFEKTVAVGKQFGVIVVVLDQSSYEVTTFRQDAVYEDGRHPASVSFCGAEEDALRRDFTVNALFLDPITDDLLDFIDGQDDLGKKILRTVGIPAERFEEDKLRVMRAVRFACQLGFEIEEGTWSQVIHFSPQLRQVSWERIRDELLKILTSPLANLGMDLLLESGILKATLPEVEAMVGVEQPEQYHPEGDVFEHTRLMFKLADAPSPTLALGVLLHDVGKPPTFTRATDRIRFHGHAEIGADMAEVICLRLRLPTEETRVVVELVRQHLRFIHVREMRTSTLKRFLRQSHFDEHLELHRLDCLASHGDLTSYHFCVEKLEELGQAEMRPPSLIGGHDLIGMGLTPGPQFSEILTRLEDLQLENQISNREQALEWVKSTYLE
jgi:poly(A) polymerase